MSHGEKDVFTCENLWLVVEDSLHFIPNCQSPSTLRREILTFLSDLLTWSSCRIGRYQKVYCDMKRDSC